MKNALLSLISCLILLSFLTSCTDKTEIVNIVAADNFMEGSIDGTAFRFATGNFGYSQSRYSSTVSTGSDSEAPEFDNLAVSGLQMTRTSEDMQLSIRLTIDEPALHELDYPQTFNSNDQRVTIQWVDWTTLNQPCPYIMPDSGIRLPGTVTITEWTDDYKVQGTFTTAAGAERSISGNFELVLVVSE